jgi:predicted TIM-barrel fold metal-dependent hydrolase
MMIRNRHFIIPFGIIQDLKHRRAQVVAELTELQNEVELVYKLMQNEEVMQNMETIRDPKALLNHLTKEFEV